MLEDWHRHLHAGIFHEDVSILDVDLVRDAGADTDA